MNSAADIEQGATESTARVVLVVEDEASVRMPIVRALRNRGLTVMEASSGPSALRMVSERPTPVDCVVTDVMMPEMRGTELIDALRLTSPNACVVFISGLPAHLADVDYRSIPGAAYLSKPFALSELADTVLELLESGAAEP